MQASDILADYPCFQPIADNLREEKWAQYSKIFAEAFQEATDKPGAWKWSAAYYGCAAGGFLITFGGLYPMLVCLKSALRPDLAHPLFRRWCTTHKQIQIGAGLGAFASLVFTLGGSLSLLEYGKRYDDPYSKLKWYESGDAHYTEPDWYVWHQLLWFDYTTFRDDPHVLKQRAYYGRMSPEEYGTAKLFVAIVGGELAEEQTSVLGAPSKGEFGRRLGQLDTERARFLTNLHTAYAHMIQREWSRLGHKDGNAVCLFAPPPQPDVTLA
ncbi:MAG: hypothetical protein AB7F31_05820 [Parachlamydiales bacterium]